MFDTFILTNWTLNQSIFSYINMSIYSILVLFYGAFSAIILLGFSNIVSRKKTNICTLIFFRFFWSKQDKIDRIFLTQKKAIRIVTNSKNQDHIAPLFLKLKILTLEKIILQAKLHFMHSVYYSYMHPLLFNTCGLGTLTEISVMS